MLLELRSCLPQEAEDEGSEASSGKRGGGEKVECYQPPDMSGSVKIIEGNLEVSHD